MSDLKSRAEAAASGSEPEPYATAEQLRAEGAAAGSFAVGNEVTPEMPDVTDSGIPAEMDVPVHVAWSRVMADVQWIGKTRRTTSGSQYNYRGVDDVMNVVAPALRKHGVMVIPIGVDPTFEVINTTKGAAMNYCRVVSRFEVKGPRGDGFIGEVLGESFDSGDKSGSKAQSVALRTFYIEALSIPTERSQLDPERGVQHEIAGPRRPTAAEYQVEILNEQTSISRLQQIKAELDADVPMGHAEVEGLDGERIELGRLVRRVGAKRMSEQGGAK